MPMMLGGWRPHGGMGSACLLVSHDHTGIDSRTCSHARLLDPIMEGQRSRRRSDQISAVSKVVQPYALAYVLADVKLRSRRKL